MKAKKNLGQNFLIDKSVITKIGESINACENDLIIEIGPGMGALTSELKKKNSTIIAYEIDTDMIPYLNKLKDNKTIFIYEDILSSNIINDIKNINYKNLYIVGNLPYYITTPIIKRLIELDLNVTEMVFMVQEEVADRFTAKAGCKEYGSITLFLKYYYYIEKLFRVNKKSFNPVPKVESAIIKFIKRNELLNVNKDKYMKLINDSFKMKRKTLKNNLSNYDFEKIKEVLNSNNLDERVRAEEIEEEIFVKICNNLK